jgi:hypothetical protein
MLNEAIGIRLTRAPQSQAAWMQEEAGEELRMGCLTAESGELRWKCR